MSHSGNYDRFVKSTQMPYLFQKVSQMSTSKDIKMEEESLNNEKNADMKNEESSKPFLFSFESGYEQQMQDQGHPNNKSLQIIQQPLKKKYQSKEAVYTKNADCYILKVAIKQMIDSNSIYRNLIRAMCNYVSHSYDKLVDDLKKYKDGWTGLLKFQELRDTLKSTSIVFNSFMNWFLKDRYMLHLLDGKIDQPKIYVARKNEMLRSLKVPIMEDYLLSDWFFDQKVIVN